MNTLPSSPLIGELLAHLQEGHLPQLAQQLGTDTVQIQNAIHTVLPMLLGALGQTSPSQGLDLASLLGTVLSSSTTTATTTANHIGTESGDFGSNTGALLGLLAPIVMSFLAQREGTGAGTVDAGGLGDGLLGKILDQDGDGQVGLGDLLKIGGNFFGGPR